MKLKGRLAQLEARERAVHHHLAQARESAAALQAAAHSLPPKLVVGAGLTVGALLARLPAKTWSMPVAGLFVVGRHAAKLPVGRWLLLALTRQKRHWKRKLRGITAAAKARPGR
ncbi:hypothetical protein [Pseudofulvimonas gallinarii]|jgi:hypothetical protein|uniref:YqjK-like protein n=1 Tax=Pseudofulvimonas gallinarii TaxID=634155 RepID=A0A4S3KV52_9GAMM|nr:hypothetical protein [Pseudofulvimonas gallinarii]TCS95133.1 hypothetical protein EDC25_12022 [Pseudofulvimonas gallinarii]THD13067.1 hypothetical protein B1808_09950 [Pseudofulvimonas gallinarii]